MTPPRLDIDSIRRRPAGTGPHYWRSLEELAQTPEFREAMEREFPQIELERSPEGRRRFLQLMGASMALAGVTGCTTSPGRPWSPTCGSLKS